MEIKIMTEIIGYLWGITTTSINVGWPLLILAFGLGLAASSNKKWALHVLAGWVLVGVGVILFIWNLRN